MDCHGSTKSEKDVSPGQLDDKNSPTEKEHTNGGGCCGSGSGMWLHLIIMFIVFMAIWYFSGR